ncbi:MAG: pyridoxamine 5'-phosphate oxidase family protein [Pseudomonadota bacterium]
MMSREIMAFVDEWRLGHIATIGPEGPNVSPKGTFQALDAGTLAFAEIRSPQTRANLAHDDRVEVNMVDVFARKGARFRGRARFEGPESDTYTALTPRWAGLFGADLAQKFRGFVLIRLDNVKPLTTPAYDVGATEMELRRAYLERFTAMQAQVLDGPGT